jgi:4a-hydroxytetrahydrobiopterin dehydratase
VSGPLAKERCSACRPGAPRVEGAEREALLADVPQWTIRSVDGVDRLERVFKFSDFAQALAFANAVGAAAEAEDHHPALLVEYGKVTVAWWTHAIGGLHRNDFVMAAKTDELAPPASAPPARA